jgi:hypothetical protein
MLPAFFTIFVKSRGSERRMKRLILIPLLWTILTSPSHGQAVNDLEAIFSQINAAIEQNPLYVSKSKTECRSSSSDRVRF